MNANKLYSPTQAALGAFLGGPAAAVLFIHSNFRTLENPGSADKTLMYGAPILLGFLIVAPFLPERFPHLAVSIAVILATRWIVEKHQLSKQAIVDSGYYEFQSNWKVLGLALACMVVFIALVMAVVIGFAAAGIVDLS